MVGMSLRRALLTLIFGSAASAADLPYVNFENHPQNGLDLSPDRATLAVVHTADQRVQLFDTSSADLAMAGSILVGVDPVSVRFRNNEELWVVNHVSDSISVINVPTRRVKNLIQTGDEPFDVVFAQNRAFVSLSQVNQIAVYALDNLDAPPQRLSVKGEDPRALAVSPDGRRVYGAVFESGNGSTVLAGGIVRNNADLPNVVNDVRGPYAGVNPPPNRGSAFFPPLNGLATPPKVSLIVKKNPSGRWLDDNGGDWSAFVSGEFASASGRVVGWNLPDRDLVIVDAITLGVAYETQLMNINAALSVKSNGEVTLVGTDAKNEIRYEPNLNGRFIRSILARVSNGTKLISDLNPHLSYASATVPQNEREESIGEPRAIAWQADGARGWVAGLSSNNVVVIDANGARIGKPIEVGAGPVSLALDESRARLYVLNQFDASISVIDSDRQVELVRVALFNPLPQPIRAGRAFLYDSHLTSGLGQASCASCHVDGRMDKLAWDLGDPSQAPAPFNQNCATSLVAVCTDYHAMKGPMSTQTLQDIIGHEPLHWRGDRRGIEDFNPAFEGLLGDDRQLTSAEMARFKAFLATITFPPNPYRNLDNSLPSNLPLPGQRTSGRFAMAGLPLPNGNAKRGLALYSEQFLDNVFRCASCHTLPTGMAVNGPVLASILNFRVGANPIPLGPDGNNHLGIVSVDGFTNTSIKVPQTRNMHEKVGTEFTDTESLSGFGFAHDGSVDSLAKFLSASLFSPNSDQDLADLVALNMAFSGSEFGDANPSLSAPAPLSKDAHAAVGKQVWIGGSTLPENANVLAALARSGKIDLIVRDSQRSYVLDVPSNRFLSSDSRQTLSESELLATASVTPQSWTAVSGGLGQRLALDRDGDGVRDGEEIAQGSDPTDALSKLRQPIAGMWFNPARSGHGFDVQFSGQTLFVSWFTFEDDGSPVWYIAVGGYQQPWRGTLNRFVFNPATGRPEGTDVGNLTMTFSSPRQGVVDWQLGGKRGQEPIVPLIAGTAPRVDRTGNWYDPASSGWGIGIYTQNGVNFSILYFYDGNNQPRWVVGQSDDSPNPQFAMNSVVGFCLDCPSVPLQLSPAGTLKIQFQGVRAGKADVDVFYPPTMGQRWQRDARLTPLSNPVVHPERH